MEPSALFHGASYTDVHARMPLALVLVGVCVVGVAAGIRARADAPELAAAGGRGPLSAGRDRRRSLQHDPSALRRVAERAGARNAVHPGHNIEATRRAFGLDQVEERQISGDALLTRDDIARNATTLQNVRLWDHQPLLDTFRQIQVIRTYYDFVTVDNDRYPINGTLRQVMLSARELDSSALQNRDLDQSST